MFLWNILQPVDSRKTFHSYFLKIIYLLLNISEFEHRHHSTKHLTEVLSILSSEVIAMAETTNISLQNWLTFDSLDVVHLSVGAYVKIDVEKTQEYVGKESSRYRVIWSLST